MRLFENMVLRRIFGTSDDNIEKNEMSGACSAYGMERRGVYRVLVGKPEGKRLLGRPRPRWEVILTLKSPN